jgi:hypothetical protein
MTEQSPLLTEALERAYVESSEQMPVMKFCLPMTALW